MARELSTTTRLPEYGHCSNVTTFSKVFRPITKTSTLAMNSSYPWGSPPPAGRKSKAPFRRAMNPSTLVPTNTDVFTSASADQHVDSTLDHAFASASPFRKSASPASETSTHFESGETSAV